MVAVWYVGTGPGVRPEMTLNKINSYQYIYGTFTSTHHIYRLRRTTSTSIIMSELAPPLYDSKATSLSDGYSLDPDELAFFKQETGIQDEAALKEHILTVQAEAYKVCTRQRHTDK